MTTSKPPTPSLADLWASGPAQTEAKAPVLPAPAPEPEPASAPEAAAPAPEPEPAQPTPEPPKPTRQAKRRPPKAKCKRAKRRPPKPKAKHTRRKKYTRREEVDVICRKSGAHLDLLGVPGFLVIDYDADDRPYEAVFDPADEDIPNAEMPVRGLLRSEGRIVVRDDEDVRWQFEIHDFDEEEPDKEDDDIEIDWDAQDYEIDEEHPFNKGL